MVIGKFLMERCHAAGSLYVLIYAKKCETGTIALCDLNVQLRARYSEDRLLAF